MAGMLLKGGASALVGTGLGAQPPITAQPAAATTSQTASGIAFGPQATPVKPGGAGVWATPGPHQITMAAIAGTVFLVWLYRSLPK